GEQGKHGGKSPVLRPKSGPDLLAPALRIGNGGGALSGGSARGAPRSAAAGLFVQPAHSFQEKLGGGLAFAFGQDALRRPDEGELAVMQTDEPEPDLPNVPLVGRRRRRPGDLAFDDTERPLARIAPPHQQQARLPAVGKYTQ